jgi:hypothetical protein
MIGNIVQSRTARYAVEVQPEPRRIPGAGLQCFERRLEFVAGTLAVAQHKAHPIAQLWPIGYRDCAVLLARSHYISNVKMAALKPLAACFERNSQEYESEGSA